jgi:hypothetical protein
MITTDRLEGLGGGSVRGRDIVITVTVVKDRIVTSYVQETGFPWDLPKR